MTTKKMIKDKKSTTGVSDKSKSEAKSPKEIRQDIRKLLHEKFSIKSK